MGSRPKLLAWTIVALLCALAPVTGCGSTEAPLEPQAAQVPAELSERYPDAGLQTASATASEGIELGVVLIEASRGSTEVSITVAGWMASDSTEQVLLQPQQRPGLLGFTILDDDGQVVIDEISIGRADLRLEGIGAGAVYIREESFTLPREGRYKVVALSSYRTRGDTPVDDDGSVKQLKTSIEVLVD